MLDVLGWIGSVAFAICGIPQAYQSLKDGHTRGLNWGFLGTWTVGEVCMFLYVLPKGDMPLILNYLGNGICLLVMLRYKIWERNDSQIREELVINYTERHL